MIWALPYGSVLGVQQSLQDLCSSSIAPVAPRLATEIQDMWVALHDIYRCMLSTLKGKN